MRGCATFFFSLSHLPLHKQKLPGTVHILQNLPNTEISNSIPDLHPPSASTIITTYQSDWDKMKHFEGSRDDRRQFWKLFYIWLFPELSQKLWFLGNKFNSAVIDPKSLISIKYRSIIPYPTRWIRAVSEGRTLTNTVHTHYMLSPANPR